MATRRRAEPEETAKSRAEIATWYKISHGSFKRRNEAVLEVKRCIKKGVRGYITVKDNGYMIEFGEYKSIEAAEKARAEIASTGIDAEITKRE